MSSNGVESPQIQSIPQYIREPILISFIKIQANGDGKPGAIQELLLYTA